MNMKKFLLATGLLFCCASASHAQVEYPDVPFEDSAYDDIYLLSPPSPADNHSYERRAMTRYEFAIVIARLLENIESKSTNQENLLLSNSSPAEVTTIKRLANKFLPELKALVIDIEQLKINSELLIEPQVAPTKSLTDSESPDVPRSDSAYADIEILWQEELVGGYSSPTKGPAWTRYEFAVAVARLVYSSGENKPDAGITFKSNIAVALKRLVAKFLPELKALGVDGEKIKINDTLLTKPKIEPLKTQIAPPFPDVPKNHWAFDSVEKLRLSGIVIGSPN